MPREKDDREGSSPVPGGEREDGAAPNVAPIRTVDIDQIEPNDWNPNVEDATTFNELVRNIEEHGFTGAIEVVELDSGRYRIIGGEHRWKAAKLLGIKQVPISVAPWDEDTQKIETFKLNLLKGKVDPAKFTAMWNSLVLKYGEDQLRRMMGLQGRDAEFRRLLKRVKQSLPEEVQQQIEARGDKIRNVEDIAAVVNSIYATYGSTLDSGFMLFSYGGQTHLMVKMTKDTFAAVKAMADDCQARGEDVNTEILRRLA